MIIIASTALASIAMLINYLGSSGATVFTTLVLMIGITSALLGIPVYLAQRSRMTPPGPVPPYR